MAHFAQLDDNNVVIQAIAVDNFRLVDENGQESEELGIQFCKKLFGETTNWLQTSYNHSFRKRFAGIGCRYIPEKNIFSTSPYYPSWTTYNIETDEWEPPIPRPGEDTEEYHWIWDESNLNWEIEYYPPIQEES
jgi:hypothetical protein